MSNPFSSIALKWRLANRAQSEVRWSWLSCVLLNPRVAGILALCMSFGSILPSEVWAQSQKEYQLIWSDEFEGEGKPDTTFWSFERGFVRNEELQWYQDENASLENGLLVINGKREDFPNPNYDAQSSNWRRSREKIEYSSSCLYSKGKVEFQYGVLEVRAKIDTAMGMWPAIWTLGIDQPWPACGEVDLMEYYLVGGRPTILANACWSAGENYKSHWDSESVPLKELTVGNDKWSSQFHIWKMDWTQDYIKLYLDDQLLNEIDLSTTTNPDGFNPFRQPHYILLNLALGSNGGDPSGTHFPRTYEIDYVRLYQQSTTR
ncbi:glycoside hydrolase family 16 protein [Reichenbachiella ulvae]|uniref:Glycoside hydrolase family 16 protein n=1 Tax=Reichenbachiella ulvae TaxID=2980104 RepID=A0ABT3CUK7_9BACT|nr:glycoside hydrolase family 16 protein [Reichenbachiella ulvae]MCV9387363.1 glycoside hydrolase family 16 protein [Reichenbachiella ulvae]